MALSTATPERRHDIDWLRVIAIGLLLLFHITLIFQSWGMFIQSEKTCEALWLPMAAIVVWRIPILFFISGMGLCFAARRRSFGGLLLERTRRILLPTIFGSFAIVPIHFLIEQKYHHEALAYKPNLWHLWFLAYIYAYVLFWGYALYCLRTEENALVRMFRSILRRPIGIYLFMIPFIIEAWGLAPEYFGVYVDNAHGFFLGALAFSFGFLFAAIGDAFWNAAVKTRYINIVLAMSLFLLSMLHFEYKPPHALSSIESMAWIFAIFGFGFKHLNKPSRTLSYLSQAAYPVYIIHMVAQYAASYFVLPLGLSPWRSFVLITVGTFGACLAAYELVIRRVDLVRPLFGLKRRKSGESGSAHADSVAQTG